MNITHEPFRLVPKVGAENFKTYGVARPIATHWRKATCKEIGCANFINGWRTTIDLNTPLGQTQAKYIRDHSGRKYTVVGQMNNVVTLEFPAGQKCFGEHKRPLEREPIFYIKGGDFRGNPMGIPTQKLRAVDWIDDFGDHQNKIADQKEKG